MGRVLSTGIRLGPGRFSIFVLRQVLVDNCKFSSVILLSTVIYDVRHLQGRGSIAAILPRVSPVAINRWPVQGHCFKSNSLAY